MYRLIVVLLWMWSGWALAESREDLSIYSDGVFVIVHSSKEKGAAEDIFSKVASIDDLKPYRVSSGYFKGLMPCWEIIAVPTKTYSEAKKIAKLLNKNKVDNYIKRPGEYIGSDPRLKAICAEPVEVAGPEHSRLGLMLEDNVYMPLMLNPALREKILENAPPQRSVGTSYDSWMVALPHETIEGFQLGQRWDSYSVDSATKETCSISGFALITRGEPHWGYIDSGEELREPKCGSPMIYAKLDCSELKAQRYVLFPFDKGGGFYSVDGEKKNHDALSEVQRQDDGLRHELSESKKEAKALGEKIKEQIMVSSVRGADPALQVIEISWTTGEGYNYCGGDDINRTISAVYLGDRRLTEFINTQDAPIKGIIQLGNGEVVIIKNEIFSDLQMINASGKILTNLPKDYCSCSC